MEVWKRSAIQTYVQPSYPIYLIHHSQALQQFNLIPSFPHARYSILHEQYIGETKRRLKEHLFRFNKHRSPVDKPTNIIKPTTASEHHHNANDISLIPLLFSPIAQAYAKLEKHISHLLQHTWALRFE